MLTDVSAFVQGKKCPDERQVYVDQTFFDREHVAAGSLTRAFQWERAADATAIHRSDASGSPDMDQTLGLDEAHKSPAEQGTLLLPPSLAIAFPPLPSTRTLLTVRARARIGCSAATKGLTWR